MLRFSNFKTNIYIIPFWVGLMDGDGSIQVNHWKRKNLQYRLVIKLKYDSNNVSMLNLIQNIIGGRVRTIHKNKIPYFIIWVVDSRKSFIKIISFFDQYQPQTTRLKAQLNFAKSCLKHNNVDIYLNTRDSKYSLYYDEPNKDCSFFQEWLSGFIEAEGCFCVRLKNNTCSFSIGQKNDRHLLEKIKNYFNIQSSIRSLKNNFYLIETYRKESLFKIAEHLGDYPLLGEKKISYEKLKNKIT